MDEQQAPPPAVPQPIQMHPNPDMLRYMQVNTEVLHDLSTQIQTKDLIDDIHCFSGGSASSFRLWLKDLKRASLEKQPVDNAFMTRLVAKTVRHDAADFFGEIRLANPNLTWAQIQEAFRDRFANYLDNQMSKQKLTTLKQSNKQTLHSFAREIIETAHEAYTDEEFETPLVALSLRDIFINGIKHKLTARLLLDRERYPDLASALNFAVYRERLAAEVDMRKLYDTDQQGRIVEHMDVDLIYTSSEQNTPSNSQSTDSNVQNQLQDLRNDIAAIAQSFKKANGQFWKNNNKQKPENHDKRTFNPPQHVDRYGHNMNRNHQLTNNTYQRPPAHPPAHPPAPTHPNHQRTYYPFVQGNQYHGYNQNRQQLPHSYGTPPRYNTQRTFNTRKVTCFHCQKLGHTKQYCWILHPELRPQRGTMHPTPLANKHTGN